jgi:hypothetical protein
MVRLYLNRSIPYSYSFVRFSSPIIQSRIPKIWKWSIWLFDTSWSIGMRIQWEKKNYLYMYPQYPFVSDMFSSLCLSIYLSIYSMSVCFENWCHDCVVHVKTDLPAHAPQQHATSVGSQDNRITSTYLLAFFLFSLLLTPKSGTKPIGLGVTGQISVSRQSNWSRPVASPTRATPVWPVGLTGLTSPS